MASSVSAIWKYFKVDDKKDLMAKCNACSKLISRGGSNPKQFGTSGLKNHLKQHPELYSELIGEQKAQETAKQVRSSEKLQQAGTSLQPTIVKCFDAQTPWDINSEKAQRMHKVIGEMICVDDDAYSKVDSLGFQRVMRAALPRYDLPGRKYFSENVIPGIYEQVKAKIDAELADSKKVTFTSDLWTSSANNSAFISLTAHFITAEFVPKKVILHTRYFPGGHSAAAIAESIHAMMQTWTGLVGHAFVTDNGSNIVKAIANTGYIWIPCAAHTLQLAVKDCLSTQRALIDLIANARGTVGHFAHSPAACSKLSVIQADLGLPQKKLVQDVVTRWNSSYYMLESMAEQRRALVMYFSEVPTSCKQLTNNEWTLLPKLLSILGPCEMTSKKLCLDTTTSSMIGPLAKALVRMLEQVTDDSGVQSTKASLIKNVDSRFKQYSDTSNLAVATLIDPRFKTAFFTSEQTAKHKTELLRMMDNASPTQSRDDAPNDDHDDEGTEMQAKRPKTTAVDLWTCMEDIAACSSCGPSSEIATDSATQLDNYLSLPRISKDTSPLDWWRSKRSEFPLLADLARQLLASPATSVASERLFSVASNILTDSRNRLSHDHAEQLIFLHENLRHLQFRY